MTSAEESATRGDATRKALIQAGMEVFGREGFHAASTRTLSEAAGVNQAAIGFHFGGKEGLYLAVFDHIAERLRALIGPIAAQAAGLIAAGGATRAARIEALGLLTDTLIEVMTQAEAEPWAQLILREQQAPTPAFDLLYDKFMGRLLGVMTLLVAGLRPDQDESANRLTVVTIMGQVLAFRAARAGVLRHLDWAAIGPGETARIKAVVRANVASIFAE